jgi:hypothetical protein
VATFETSCTFLGVEDGADFNVGAFFGRIDHGLYPKHQQSG